MQTIVVLIADKAITISWLLPTAFNVIIYQTVSNAVPPIVMLVAFAKLDTMLMMTMSVRLVQQSHALLASAHLSALNAKMDIHFQVALLKEFA